MIPFGRTRLSIASSRILLLVTLLGAVQFPATAAVEYIDPDNKTGTAAAVVLDPAPLVHTTQILPLDKAGKLAGADDVSRQTELVLKKLGSVLTAAKSDLKQTVKLNVYVARAELTSQVSEILARRFNTGNKPAVTFVGGPLPDGALVAMDAVAVSTASGEVLQKVGIRAGSTEATILPANASVIYVAGMADKNDLRLATRNTLEKLKGAISHFGLDKKDIVQLKAFTQPMAQMDVVRDEVKKFFGEETVPPIIYVEWISTGLPIEIEMIAAAPATNVADTVSYITPPGTTSAAVFSRVGRINGGKRIYISGLYGTSTPENDVKEIYQQLDDLLKKTGTDINHLVKATYYFSEPSSNGRLDALRPKIYDPKRPPSASKARVNDVGLPGKGICIDMIAVTPK